MKIVKKFHRTATERRFMPSASFCPPAALTLGLNEIRMLTTSLLVHGEIKTTVARAKEMRRFVDRIINLAQEGDQHSRRQAEAFIFGKGIVDNIFREFPEKFPTRRSGFTRVRLAGYRKGDRSYMAYIQLIEPDNAPKEVPIAAAAPEADKKKAEEL